MAPSSAAWDTREPGTYMLGLLLTEPVCLTVGRLGTFTFPMGRYAYVGSALGGLGARLRRHLRSQKRRHWHIDTLRSVGTVERIYWHVGRERLECQVAAALLSMPSAKAPAIGFGSSDSRCVTHLVHLAEPPPAPPGWGACYLLGQPASAPPSD